VRAEQAAKHAIATSWDEVISDLNLNLSSPGEHGLK
jgi:hypothetical protein